MVVDDEPANLRMLERLFRNDYEVVTAASGAEALELLNRHDIALIISDQRMPGMTGIEFLKQAANMRPQTVRVVLTGYTDVSDLVEAINSCVIYKYITKPWVNTDLCQTVQRGLEFYETTKRQHWLAQENIRLETRLQTTVQGFVNAVREMIALKRPDLADHSRRTSNYAALIGEQFNLPPQEMEELIFASLLHEVSHIRMPIEIDFSPSSLSADRYREMRIKYETGLRVISSVPDLQDVATIISYQHERFDGKGLFHGLDGEKIPFSSRILAVANAFDEINSGRKPELFCTDEEAADWMRERAGTQFDPHIVEVCLGTELLDATSLQGALYGAQTGVGVAARL